MRRASNASGNSRPSGPVRIEGGTAGALIRARRTELGITQNTLAETLDVSRQTVIAMESGDYAPSVFLAVRVARALDTTVETLWGADAH